MFCLRVMVGVIILYDHVHLLGAFCKASNIDVSELRWNIMFYVLGDSDTLENGGLLTISQLNVN